MNISFKYKDKLVEEIKREPYVEISDIKDYLFQVSNEHTVFIPEKKMSNVYFNCLDYRSYLKQLLLNFKGEVKSNLLIKKLEFDHYGYIEELITEFTDLEKLFNTNTIKDELFIWRKDIGVYNEPVALVNPLVDDLTIFPDSTIQKISDYINYQKSIVLNAITFLKSKLSQSEELNDTITETDKITISSEENFITVENNDSDDRINLGIEPEEIRTFFSFLSQSTSRGKIMSDEDLTYFLNKNFTGFPVNRVVKQLSFSVIRNVDFSFIIFKFYKKYCGNKKYPPLRWAQLLHDSFPTKFQGKVENTASNLKQNSSTIPKLIEFKINHPFN